MMDVHSDLNVIGDPDDGLAATAVGRVESRSRLCERTHRTEQGHQSSVSQPEFERGEMSAIGFDDKEDRASIVGPHTRWFGDGYQHAARADQFGGAIENITAEDVEHHVDFADVLQSIALHVQEGVRL